TRSRRIALLTRLEVLDVPAVLSHELGQLVVQDHVELAVSLTVVLTLLTGEVPENDPNVLERDVAKTLLVCSHCVSVSFRGVAVVVLLCLNRIYGTDVAEAWTSASCPALGRVLLGIRPGKMISESRFNLLGGWCVYFRS